MIKYNNNIDTYETRTKVNKNKQRPIYEVINKAYMKYSRKSQVDSLKNVWIIKTEEMIYQAS